MTTTADLCTEALSHHRAGRLEVAERLYRAILALDEEHAEAHHNLGVIAIERGNFAPGLTHLRRALELASGLGGYWLSLAEGLLAAQQLDEARAVMERARAIGLDTPAARALLQRLAASPMNRAPPITSRPDAKPLVLA